MNPAAAFAEALMIAVARRIATLAAQGQVQQAKEQYLAHTSAMSPEEIVLFDRAICQEAMAQGGAGVR